MVLQRWTCLTALFLALGITWAPASQAANAGVFDDVSRTWHEPTSDASSTLEGATPEGSQLVDLQNGLEADGSLERNGGELVDVQLLGGGNNGRLLGFIGQSDRAFYYFISPQSNPLLFEDPRTVSEVRAHFVNQWIPNNNPVFLGGTAQYVALQARVALTERLSFIATKDGYIWLNPTNPAVGNPEGFADVAGGLKYNLIRNPATQTIVSAGFTYDFIDGARRVFQGNGNGEFNVFLTGGREFFEVFHWMGNSGLRLPLDTNARSSMYWSSHAFDVMLTRRLYLTTQFNWFHWFESGGALPVDFEGSDLFNLGSNNVAGNDLVTQSVGTRFKFGRYHETGIAYELPLTQRKDLMEGRFYFDVILRY